MRRLDILLRSDIVLFDHLVMVLRCLVVAVLLHFI